jgi:hypothetical protein
MHIYDISCVMQYPGVRTSNKGIGMQIQLTTVGCSGRHRNAMDQVQELFNIETSHYG